MWLLINHPNKGVPQSINNSHDVWIGLCVINHESFEIQFRKAMLLHRVIELCPHYLLNLHVFILHVTNHNGHHFAIGQIVHMTNHSCLTNHMLHMIKHAPSILQVPERLHVCDNTHTTPHTIYGHLENEQLLSKNLFKEVAFLDIVIWTFGFQFKDINVTTAWMMLERNNKVTNVGRAQ